MSEHIFVSSYLNEKKMQLLVKMILYRFQLFYS